MRKFYHGSFVQDIFGVSNLSLFIMHLCKQLLGCKFRCFVSHGDCLSPLWNFGRKSKTTSLYEPMSFLLMMLLTITPKTPHTHTHKKRTMDINERFCWRKGDFDSKARRTPFLQVPARTANRVNASAPRELRLLVNWTRYLMEGVCSKEAHMYFSSTVENENSLQTLYHSINAAVYPTAMNLCLCLSFNICGIKAKVMILIIYILFFARKYSYVVTLT